MRYVSEAAGMEHVGLRVYRVEPGERIPLSGLHYHEGQEAVLYVLDGTLHVETPDEVDAVDAGEFFVAEPESPHTAHNPAEASADVRVIGMGAPPLSDGHSVDE